METQPITTPVATTDAPTEAPAATTTTAAGVPTTINVPTTTVATPFTSASLYVGDLKPDVSEAGLFEVFKACGNVASIRVCRDAITRRSLGYAYVNFHNQADAERALETLNFSLINNKPCRIMWSHRDPARRKSGLGNIYIKGLAETVNNSQLLDTFSKFGDILSCKVETGDDGKSKGFGYVHFGTEEAAKAAIEKVNGMLIEGKPVFVGPFQSRRDRTQLTGKEMMYTNIYIKNLSPSVTDEQLCEMFAPFGKITSGVVMKDAAKTSRGFAFCNFETHEAAKAAVEGMNGKTSGEKQLYVCRAQKKSEHEQEKRRLFDNKAANSTSSQLTGANLYVRNLEDSITEEELKTLFNTFGTITSATVMLDAQKRSRGFGFVCYSNQEDATKALSEMNGSIVHQKPLYVSMAQKKEDRQRQLRQLHRSPYNFTQQVPQMWYGGYAQVQRPMMSTSYPQQMIRWPQNTRQRMQYGYPQMGQVASGVQMAPAQIMASQGMQMAYRNQRSGIPIVRRAPGTGSGLTMQRVQQQQQQQQRRGPYPHQPAMVQQMAPIVAPIDHAAAAAVAQQAVPVQQQVVMESGSGALSKEEFNSLSAAGSDELKQALGERLFNHVMVHYPAQTKCGKITGMLLESMDLNDLNTLLDDSASLKSKIDEANNVFEEHQRKQETSEVPQ